MYLNFFLAEEDDRISASDSNSSESASLDCFEGVLDLIESSLIAEDGDVVLAALSWFTHNLKTIQILFKDIAQKQIKSVHNIKDHLPFNLPFDMPPISPHLYLE